MDVGQGDEQVDDGLEKGPLAGAGQTEKRWQLGRADEQRTGIDEAVEYWMGQQVGKMGQAQGTEGHLQNAGQHGQLDGQQQVGFGTRQGQRGQGSCREQAGQRHRAGVELPG